MRLPFLVAPAPPRYFHLRLGALWRRAIHVAAVASSNAPYLVFAICPDLYAERFLCVQIGWHSFDAVSGGFRRPPAHLRNLVTPLRLE